MTSSHPIVVVTGANAGVGFGVCKRLLFQLSYAHPPDSEPEFVNLLDRSSLGSLHVSPCSGLTLVLACRSLSKAEVARKELYAALDEELATRKRQPGYDGHGDLFRANVKINVQYIDMASMGSVFAAAKELSQKYPYISHIICNAGVNAFSHINWWLAIKQVLSRPITAVSVPRFMVAVPGERSADGLGWVWQCNVFAHYTLFRQLKPSLRASNDTPLGPARVLWTTSLESSAAYYNSDDWQLTKTPDLYALSKFQMDILATRLDILACENKEPIRHLLVQPGFCSTNIVGGLLTGITTIAMGIAFWLARWLGSVHHTIHRETAAYSVVHIALIPLTVIPAYLKAFATHPERFSHSILPFEPMVANIIEHKEKPTIQPQSTARVSDGKSSAVERPVRFGSETDRHGNARLGLTEVPEWNAYEHESEVLHGKFEALYQQFLEEEKLEKVGGVESFNGEALNGRA